MRGDPGSGRPIQCVTKYKPRCLSWLVFTIYPSIPTEVSSPPERNDNAKLRRHPNPQQHPNSQRHHHLSSISLASKREPKVDFSTVSMPLPLLPPPPHPNASRRWTFLAFQHVWYHHHLPCIQMQAGAGLFSGFKAAAITSIPLVFKCEPEVNFFGVLTPLSGGILPTVSGINDDGAV